MKNNPKTVNPKTSVKRTAVSSIEVTSEQMVFTIQNEKLFKGIVASLIEDLKPTVEVAGKVLEDVPVMTVAITIDECPETAEKDSTTALNLATRLVTTIMDAIDEMHTRIGVFKAEFNREYKNDSVKDVILGHD